MRTTIIKKLANLQFAIGLLFAIGLIISIGTIIEQDQSLTFYKENYPENNPLFGFLTWQVITVLNLNKVYTAWWFLLILLLFGGSLLACTLTTQLPSIKTFKIWKFLNQPQYANLILTSKIEAGLTNTVAYQCNKKKYHFFKQKNKGYAYSGLLGRVAPIVVHGSIIILLIGSSIGSLGGFVAQEIVPRGELVHVQNLISSGDVSSVTQAVSCRINDFWITYTKDSKTDQFYSDLSILDEQGKELKRKIVFVNEPLNYENLAFYQTDWDVLGLKFRFENGDTFQLPLKKINKGGRKFWFGSLTVSDDSTKNWTIVLNDLNGKLYVYDSKGALITEVLLGENIILENNISFQFTDYITSTGLQIKSDPGIATVYFSFLLLMASIYVSFFTYSQIWLVEAQNKITLGGKSNRAVLFFQEEFRKIISRSTKVSN